MSQDVGWQFWLRHNGDVMPFRAVVVCGLSATGFSETENGRPVFIHYDAASGRLEFGDGSSEMGTGFMARPKAEGRVKDSVPHGERHERLAQYGTDDLLRFNLYTRGRGIRLNS